MTFNFLPAFNGDCFIVSFLDQEGINRNILIDGGVGRTYPRYLKAKLHEIMNTGEYIDLLVITHIDDDHIAGVIKLFEDEDLDHNVIKNVWFNSGMLLSDYFKSDKDDSREVRITPSGIVDMSVKQGNTLEKKLLEYGGWHPEVIVNGSSFNFHGMTIQVLSPSDESLSKLNKKWETETDTQVQMSSKGHDDFKYSISDLAKNKFKEDGSVPNGSSIALLVDYDSKKALLLGDAHPGIVEDNLRLLGYHAGNQLKVDVVKLSHHGSKGNTSDSLLEVVACQDFVVLTDGSRHGLPDKESLARIITYQNSPRIHFNYKNEVTSGVFSNDDFENHEFEQCFLADNGNKLVL